MNVTWIEVARMFELYGKKSGAKIRTKRSNSKHLQFDQYVDYTTLMGMMSQIVEKDKEVARVVHLTPRTAQNRSIVALELQSDRQSKKPGILIIGALNAMAWGAPNAIMELADRLLYDSNYQTPYFNDYDWYLIPMANPDGLEFSKGLRQLPPVDATMWSRNVTARFKTRPTVWHKNIDTEASDVCFGTNINRNFAFHWQDDVHKMPERCSQYYPGTKPFSTAEAQALRAYLEKMGDVIDLAIHLHASFVPKKEYILFPWRYSTRLPSNFRTLQAIGEYSARHARLPDGRLYEVHQSSNDNRVAGSISDYVSGVVGTDLVYLIKPYYPQFPNYTDSKIIEVYAKKAITAILSLVRGWRSSTKLNTLYFFGKEVEF
ncbi:carboxypeptidase B-like isoform X1 [Pectinophora gossypiella]|uniref:carboxypeptidase B-like isoform X1 n=2 Tax=Pectinophora gossypiella TaxID=13191 RepID=UPI00214EAD6B|nr:carboxypeptidase B-like isoform X1 [Pectinophora gossypiella]